MTERKERPRREPSASATDQPAVEPTPAPPAAAELSATPAVPSALGLAARLRRETPVEASALIAAHPAAGHGDGETGGDAPRIPLRERLRAREAGVELLLFRVGGDLFAADLLAVEEARELGEVHPVPAAPPAMLGVCGLRGRLLPVYSPERALAHPARPSRQDAYVLVLRAATGTGRPVGLVVDDVEDVLTANLAEAQDLSEVDRETAASSGALAGAHGAAGSVWLGVLHWKGELVALVDTDALVAACAAPAEGAVREAAAREIS